MFEIYGHSFRIESFHDKFRDECLNREIFGSLLEAKVVVEQWRMEYNQDRPHSSLRYKTPKEMAKSSLTSLRPLAFSTPEEACFLSILAKLYYHLSTILESGHYGWKQSAQSEVFRVVVGNSDSIVHFHLDLWTR